MEFKRIRNTAGLPFTLHICIRAPTYKKLKSSVVESVSDPKRFSLDQDPTTQVIPDPYPVMDPIQNENF